MIATDKWLSLQIIPELYFLISLNIPTLFVIKGIFPTERVSVTLTPKFSPLDGNIVASHIFKQATFKI